MHKSLNTYALAGAAMALAITPAMVAAQDETMAEPSPETPAEATPAPGNTDRSAKIAAWPAEKQAAFKAWPPETQAYYWSLTEERQKIFWALADRDKVSLSQMPEAQRESAWTQIEARAKPPRA